MAVSNRFPEINATRCGRIQQSRLGLVDIQEVICLTDIAAVCGQANPHACFEIDQIISCIVDDRAGVCAQFDCTALAEERIDEHIA